MLKFVSRRSRECGDGLGDVSSYVISLRSMRGGSETCSATTLKPRLDKKKTPAWVHEVHAAQEQLEGDRASDKNDGNECDDFDGEEEGDSTLSGGHRQPDTAICFFTGWNAERGACWRAQQRVDEEFGSDARTSLRDCDVA